MALNFLSEVDTSSTGDDVPEAWAKAVTNFALIDDMLHGFYHRAKLRWKDADEIYIGAGVYFHEGTTDQMLYWTSELTFQLGSGGTNSNSDDLAASEELHYLYIDDSAVVTSGVNLLTNTEFLNDTTAPTWSQTKQSWYNGNDRCIGCVKTDSSGNILEFFQSGDFVLYADEHATVYQNADISETWTDVALDMPAFSTRAEVQFRAEDDTTTTATLNWRTNGQTGTVGHVVLYSHPDGMLYHYAVMTVITDSAQKIEIVTDTAAATVLWRVRTHGWYLPEGM